MGEVIPFNRKEVSSVVRVDLNEGFWEHKCLGIGAFKGMKIWIKKGKTCQINGCGASEHENK